MKSLLDYEAVSNPLLAILKTPQQDSMADAISEMKAILLVPLSSTLANVPITKQFLASHIAIPNPTKPSEVLTVNGLLCCIEEKETNKFLRRLSDRTAIKIEKDSAPLFNSKRVRSLFDSYSEAKVLQSVHVLREGEVMLKKVAVPIMLIDSPLSFKEESAKTNSKASVAATVREVVMKRMKSPLSKDISQTITNFKDYFVKNYTKNQAEEQGRVVHDFIEGVIENLPKHSLWKNSKAEELEEAYEYIEKFLMKELFSVCFSTTKELKDKDKEISDKIQKVQWVAPENLEIRPQHQSEKKFNMAITGMCLEKN